MAFRRVKQSRARRRSANRRAQANKPCSTAERKQARASKQAVLDGGAQTGAHK